MRCNDFDSYFEAIEAKRHLKAHWQRLRIMEENSDRWAGNLGSAGGTSHNRNWNGSRHQVREMQADWSPRMGRGLPNI